MAKNGYVENRLHIYNRYHYKTMNTSDARQVIKNLANETVSLSNLTEKQQREFCKSVSHMVCEITDSSLQDYYYEQTMEFLQDKELCDNLSDRIKQSDRQI